MSTRKVALLATNGVEEIELIQPRNALQEAGFDTVLISPANSGSIKAWNHDNWGESYEIDLPLNDARAIDYEGLVLPGGVMNPDSMRQKTAVQTFISDFFIQNKMVAAICHAPWLLIDAGVTEGRKLTSYHTLKTDLKNAGAKWVDQSVVVDKNLITSRNPDDIPDFNQAILDKLGSGTD